MRPTLPFRLKVPGTDEFRGVHAVSTSFRFQGLLRLEADSLVIEWAGDARVQDVGALSVRDERLLLPREGIVVPCARLRQVELRGGWWRPRLVISGRDLTALSSVPSEQGGTVRFWYARRDRHAAAALAVTLTGAIAAAAIAAATAVSVQPALDDPPLMPSDGFRRT